MPSLVKEERLDFAYLWLGFTLFWFAGAGMVLQWRSPLTAAAVGGALCILPTPTSERRARLLLWGAGLALGPLPLLAVLSRAGPREYLTVALFGVPFGFAQGLDSGLGKPNWQGLTVFLDNITRGAFLLAGVLALVGRRYGASIPELSSYLTGQYSFLVYVIGAVLLLAGFGYVCGVPYGAGVRRYARLFTAA